MPNLLTHAYFSIDINNLVERKVNDIKTLKLFSYGPDAFYFSNPKMGKIMHRKKIDDFFKNYIMYIKEKKLNDCDEIMASLYGLITHYVLDSTIHPFIFYKSGVFDNNSATKKYMDRHRITELYLDKYMACKRGVELEKFKLYGYLFPKSNHSIILKNCLNDVFYKTFGLKNGYNIYFKGLRNMKRYFKYFRFDYFGFKYLLYKFLDLFRQGKEKLVYVSYYKIKWADLNINNKSWHHPVTNLLYFKSVDDLYIDSLYEATSIINKVNDIIDGKRGINDITFNKSYINGLDYRKKNVLRYFEEIENE